MTSRSVVGPKGQITIPKDLREKYHMLEGEEVVLLPQGEGVLLKHPSTTLRGSLKGRLDLSGIEQEVEKLRGEWKM